MKYSKEFKEEALKLSDEIGLKKAAQQWNCQEMCSQEIPKILDRPESGSVMSQSC